MTDDAPKIARSRDIATELFHPNPWNPNEQTAETFNALVEEIREDGFEQPVNAVACECDLIAERKHFMLIGGEHRWKAAKVLGYSEIPAYIHDAWDEQAQKLKTVRRNLMTGTLNDSKFTELVLSLEEQFSFSREELAGLMGFDAEAEMLRHILAEKTKAEKTFVDGLMEEAKKDKYAVDSLTDIIATIFGETAATVDQNFLFFAFKGALQMVVLCDPPTMVAVKEVAEHLRDSTGTATDFFGAAIAAQLNVEKIGKD